MYDEKCLELARHFLSDHAQCEAPELAQHIQDAVESWFGQVDVDLARQ